MGACRGRWLGSSHSTLAMDLPSVLHPSDGLTHYTVAAVRFHEGLFVLTFRLRNPSHLACSSGGLPCQRPRTMKRLFAQPLAYSADLVLCPANHSRNRHLWRRHQWNADIRYPCQCRDVGGNLHNCLSGKPFFHWSQAAFNAFIG